MQKRKDFIGSEGRRIRLSVRRDAFRLQPWRTVELAVSLIGSETLSALFHSRPFAANAIASNLHFLL